MKLTDHQQKMLDGAFGKGKAMAVQIQIGVGKCFDAERLVPVSRAHVSLSAQEADIWFAGKLLDAGASCAVAPTVNPGYSVDYFRSRLTDAAVENMRKTERIYRGLGARHGLTAVHRNGRHGVFYGVGRESAVKQRRERYFRERERGIVHGEHDTGGALHGVRGLSGGQRIRAAEKAVFTAHIPRGVHRRGSGLRRRFSGCFRYGRRRDRRRSGRAEKADAGAEERKRREQHDGKHRARDDEPDGLFPVFHRFFCFVYLGHGMPPKRKCAGDRDKNERRAERRSKKPRGVCACRCKKV